VVKLQPTGQNLGRVFNFRNGRVPAVHFLCYKVKLPNLKLKTRLKQLSSFLLLNIMLTSSANVLHTRIENVSVLEIFCAEMNFGLQFFFQKSIVIFLLVFNIESFMHVQN
jgi:hypothetical protein